MMIFIKKIAFFSAAFSILAGCHPNFMGGANSTHGGADALFNNKIETFSDKALLAMLDPNPSNKDISDENYDFFINQALLKANGYDIVN